MRQYGIEACLMQETRQEGENFNKEVNIYNIFNHNLKIGGGGDKNLWKEVGIIL